ncbi:unnamed protein product, partial [Musa textilis]
IVVRTFDLCPLPIPPSLRSSAFTNDLLLIGEDQPPFYNSFSFSKV